MFCLLSLFLFVCMPYEHLPETQGLRFSDNMQVAGISVVLLYTQSHQSRPKCFILLSLNQWKTHHRQA